jgi:hypothetical protein
MNCAGCGNQTDELHAGVALCATCRSRARVAELERELAGVGVALDGLDVPTVSEVTGEPLNLVERIQRLGGLAETHQWHAEQLLAAALK